MKKLLIALALCLLLTSCTQTEGTDEPIDIAGEMQAQPTFTLSFGETTLTGSNGSFCSAVLCFDQGTPNPATLNYTNYTNGTGATLTMVKGDATQIESVFITLKSDDWKTVQNNVKFDSPNSGTYKITNPFIKTGNYILNLKIEWTAGGYSNIYFPLNIQ